MPETSREKLTRLKAMSLDDKEAHACDQLERYYYHEKGNVYLSFSGGKDSTVVKYIIDHKAVIPPDSIPAVFCQTGLEFPEIYDFAKEHGAEVIRPDKSFKQVLIEKGYPLISKEISMTIEEVKRNPNCAYRAKMYGEGKYSDDSRFNYSKWLPLLDLPIKISDKCCNELKKKPFQKYEKTTGRHKIRGITVSESLLRNQSWLRRGGCTAFSDESKHPVCDPLSPWSEQDILTYIKREDIKIADPYGDIVENKKGKLECTKRQRTGCIFCPFGMHNEHGVTRYQRLAQTHPKLYEYSLSGGEWVYENGKQIWVPNSKGLGFAKVFDMVNEIYGKDFYRYEALPYQYSVFDKETKC